MVVALLALMILASFVFYVFNTGHHITARIETQNAADAAAISGAGWIARSFNTVAMNNVETARLISYVAVLDAVPQAIDYTIIDQTAVLNSIDNQLKRDLSALPWLSSDLAEARYTFEQQLLQLDALNELFDASNHYDLAQMTHYRTPDGGRGALWQAIDALGGMSQASMETITPLAVLNASEASRTNQQVGVREGSGTLIPWEIDIPWAQGPFTDFRRPVLEGRLPDTQDDPQTNRGPFDTLFGFRTFRLSRGQSSPPSQSTGEYVLQPYRLRAQGWIPTTTDGRLSDDAEALSYNTYGAYRHMRTSGMDLGRGPYTHTSPYQQAWSDPRKLSRHPLAPSLWARHLGFIADRKINFCFPGAASNRVVQKPRWVLSYDEAADIQAAGQPVITHGLYLVYNYYRNEFDNDLLSTTAPPLLDHWGLLRVDRDVLNPPNLPKITDHIWRDEQITRQETLDGTPYRRRHLRYYVYVGVQVGEPAAVANPFNFDAEDRNRMAGPINFPPEYDPRKGLAPSPFGREDRSLTYLGVAYQSKQAPFWSARFDGNRPDRHHVGIAQAEVFNNHSWDLWTQMWHAQLTPVDQYGDWLSLMDETQPNDAEFAEVRSYLHAVQPLVEFMTPPRN